MKREIASRMKTVFVFLLVLLMPKVTIIAGDIIKIMPVGNSITAGEHYGHPAPEERTGYRKSLYEMLMDTGYNVDFVGSQTHGNLPTYDPNWYDWNNEGYPGKAIPYIAGQVHKGLSVYKPDILLVHVGTNGRDWDDKPGQVMTMLDSIDKFSVDNDHPITVFLCKIIQRYYLEDSVSLPDPPPTSVFNIAVEDTVATRSGDKIKIIVVDMEYGAGLDYSDSLPDPTATPPYEGGDMWGHRYPLTVYDKYHPNDKGNTKMAVKFYEELVKELDEPDSLKDNMVADIKLTAIRTDSIQITWTGNFVDEEGYIIERALPGGDFSELGTTNANTRSFIDNTADATKEYRYRVKAFNAKGESLNSEEVRYVPVYYTLTTSVVGEGTVDPSSGTYLAGPPTTITLTATPAPGWKFKKWSGDLKRTSSPVPFTIVGDANITANFEELVSSVSTQTNSVYRFYPNPVNDELIIERRNEFSQSAVIQIFDNTGRLLLNQKTQGVKHIIDMGNLSPGIYLIKVSDIKGETIIKRIAKQ